jgi:hypothetical protein
MYSQKSRKLVLALLALLLVGWVVRWYRERIVTREAPPASGVIEVMEQERAPVIDPNED